jgi:hypothetical protein
MIICECKQLPRKNRYKNISYSSIPTRKGRKSIPFLGLSYGNHKVLFKTPTKERLCIVRAWLSAYGWAWQILKDVVDK